MLRFISCFAFRYSALVFFLIGQLHCFAFTKSWTGASGDGLWSNAANWKDNSLPIATDDVVFDNSLLFVNYTVNISLSDSILIHSLTISPGSGHSIRVTIDSLCTRQVSLTLFAIGYSMIIDSGGAFVNASKVSSGNVLVMTDSLLIRDGGWYKHASRRPHAPIVTKLARSPGTEHGNFEFDLPSGTGTLSISNRVYGNLILSAVSAGGLRTYSGTGSNPLTINGDLLINPGVNFSIDLTGSNGNVAVKGNLHHNGLSLNLASGAGNTTILHVAGNLWCATGSQVTETNTGFPVIELNGAVEQRISLAGSILNAVGFRLNNSAGAVLLAPLSLPYKLELVTGKLTTTTANLLTLQAGCVVSADTIAANSFVDGPLRKLGLSGTDHFLFPSGKSNQMRWVELKNVTGDFTIEFINSDPRSPGLSIGPGIDHISSNDYWTIDAGTGTTASANVELSFRDGSSSGVTDMNTLRVAQLSGNIWTDRNNTLTTGSAGSSGSVVSGPLESFGPSAVAFVLASSTATQNPLPVKLLNFKARGVVTDVLLEWEIDAPGDAAYFNIMAAPTDREFRYAGEIKATAMRRKYQFILKPPYSGMNYYRLQVFDKNGNSYYSRIIPLFNDQFIFSLRIGSASVVNSVLGLTSFSPERGKLRLVIFSADGRPVKGLDMEADAGKHNFSVDVSNLPNGIYFVTGMQKGKRATPLKFIKQ